MIYAYALYMLCQHSPERKSFFTSVFTANSIRTLGITSPRASHFMLQKNTFAFYAMLRETHNIKVQTVISGGCWQNDSIIAIIRT